MNFQNILSSLSQSSNPSSKQNSIDTSQQQSSPLDTLSSMLPGGLAGGAAASGVMALLMSSKSARKIATGAAKIGGTAVLGGLAYKAYGNWQKNKALNQTKAITADDVEQSNHVIPVGAETAVTRLNVVLIKTMIAASKADGHVDAIEQKRLFEAVAKLDLDSDEKASIFGMMSRDISIQEIVDAVEIDGHKAEVYLAAYLSIDVDEESERQFLNDLATGLELPKGFPEHLEQQADQGIAA